MKSKIRKMIKAINESLDEVKKLQKHYMYEKPNKKQLTYAEGVESALIYVLELIEDIFGITK